MMTENSHTHQNNNTSPNVSICVVHSDDEIIVIDKPCDLRSVPGHANPPPCLSDINQSCSLGNADSSDNTVVDFFHENIGHDHYLSSALKSQRRTAQEAWVDAIKSYAPSSNGRKSNAPSGDCLLEELLQNLGTTADPSSVPRKLDTFIRYCNRNCRRLLPLLFVKESSTKQHSKNSDHSGSTKVDRHVSKKQKIGEKRIVVDRNILQSAYAILQQTQRPLMNLPKPTEDSESALGQLRLLGFGDFAHYNLCNPSSMPNSSKFHSDTKNAKNCHDGGNDLEQVNNKLHVVHRLDCQTSGVMVVARNPSSASFLCQAWRERDTVQKTYLAHVEKWPPYHEQGMREGKIDLPLAASRTERIKWEVRPLDDGGKASLTFWKVCKDHKTGKVFDNDNAEKTEGSAPTKIGDSPSITSGVTLELYPQTGRTHQLRIHCAEIGSGISGDSLYGDSPIDWCGNKDDNDLQWKQCVQGETEERTKEKSKPITLRLHAYELTFPHPKTGEKVTFVAPKSWN